MSGDDVKVVAFLVSSRTGAIHAHYVIDGLPGEHGMELPLENFLPHIRADVEALAAIVQTATSDSWRDSLADAAKLPDVLADVRNARAAQVQAQQAEADAVARKEAIEAEIAQLATATVGAAIRSAAGRKAAKKTPTKKRRR